MAQNIHESHIESCLQLATKSPPKPSNYCVGAVLVAAATNTVLATGYTLELPGNTHAEQCALAKFVEESGLPEERIGEALPPELDAVIYTSMEPCIERLSGNLPCVDTIIKTRSAQKGGGIQRVYTGVSEPDKFVKHNEGKARLQRAGIEVVHVHGFEERTLEIATAGHDKH